MTRQRSTLEIFTEIGLGNPSFVSREIEKDGREKRIKGCVRYRIRGVYLRLWLGYRVIILSTLNGFEIEQKPRRAFKFILGVRGYVNR